MEAVALVVAPLTIAQGYPLPPHSLVQGTRSYTNMCTLAFLWVHNEEKSLSPFHPQ